MTQDDSDLKLPSQALEVAGQAVLEILGEAGAKAVAKSAGLSDYLVNGKLAPGKDVTFGHVGRVTQALIDLYGERGAGALLRRVGRVQFLKWQEAYPAALGVAGVALKALPPSARVKMVLKAVAMAAKQIVDVQAAVEDVDHRLRFSAKQCPYCSGVHNDQPFCMTAIGALEEVTRWATGERWIVTEETCRAAGADACRFLLLPPEAASAE